MNMRYMKPKPRGRGRWPHRAEWIRALGLAFTVVAFFSSAAVAALQANWIELSTEPVTGTYAGHDIPGPRTLYVFHHNLTSTTAVRFRIQAGPGVTVTYVSETHPFPQTLGDTQTGITVCYGGQCLSGDQLLATVTYMFYGTSADCSKLLIVPHPDAETVEEMDCDFVPQQVAAWDFTLYAVPDTYACPLSWPHVIDGTPKAFGCSPVAAEETTWGRIKALYR
ncbi:MAG TPA: hypothetical protein VFX92_06825, partial [Candidatus Krumholzibacteria bacterium]|nr:hypothetical protein [Candidatus Krumholzibacteria bacterium]